MNSHEKYEKMLVVRDELTLTERSRLDDHVPHCRECQQAAHIYTRNAEYLASLPPASAPGSLRQDILRDVRRAARRPPPRFLRSLVQGAGLAAIVVAMGWFGTPLGSAVASAFQFASPAPGSGPSPTVCNGAPWLMLSPGMHLLAPRQYQLGGGQLLPTALTIARRDMPGAQYWAIYGYETRVGLCRPGIERDIVIGHNPKAGTELVAVDVRPRIP